MPRFFTLAQARNLLPEVEESVREAVYYKAEFEKVESDWQSELRRIMMMGGSLVDRDRLAALKSHRGESAAKLKDAIDKIQSQGCLIKDLDVGLIDFPTLFRGDEVYLCWKLGETGIHFWHGVTEGFQGRKKIGQDFIDHHKGDLTN